MTWVDEAKLKDRVYALESALSEVRTGLLAPFSESDDVPGTIGDAVERIDAALEGRD